MIGYNEKGYWLTDEAKALLMAVPDEHSLSIVSVVGKYRTGKSFFINRVLLGKEGGEELPGFEVGPTV